MKNIEFKAGMYDLHEHPNFNFQLNRTVMWDGGDLEDIKAAAHKITDNHSWKRELIALGDRAMREKRIQNAIAYFRMSEFFMYDGDEDKLKYYRLATELFYDYYKEYFTDGVVERLRVPYDDVYLPVMHVKPQDKNKDIILLHGGNDSYFEELFFPMLYFAQNGFEVYLIEGPGQGGVVREQHKHFTPCWEKPVGNVLDYFGLNNITIIGASLGGMLAPRAAAFDKRIQRVIGWSVFPNFLDIGLQGLPKAASKLIRFMIFHNMKGCVNAIAKRIMKMEPTADWAVRHGMYAYEAETPYEYIRKLNDYQMIDIADKITQDVLVIGAKNDHFIPQHFYKMELDSLTNVRSLTYRLFTEAEQAANHCNAGNTRLVLDTMMCWIEQILERDSRTMLES